MQPLLAGGTLVAVVAVSAGLWATRPVRLDAATLAVPPGNALHGAEVFWAAGCASCHVTEGAVDADLPVLSGGQAFATDFGTFHAPNVSMDPQAGIGAWSYADFANAVQRGVSPEGAHYYPAFPYAAYALAAPADIADLWAFWQTLPASDVASVPHDVGFPFSIRRGVGLWKQLYTGHGYAVAVDGAVAERGRYLSEALGHCGECHTPRDALGGSDRDAWLAGAPNPSGRGRIPNITPAVLNWSEAEIAAYLTDGFTPAFDVAGGHMARVVRNLARLPDADRQAIAAYLKQVLPVANPAPAEG